MNFDTNDIKNLVGGKIYSRGLLYFSRGMIDEIIPVPKSKDCYVAFVEGRNDNEYEVYIDFEKMIFNCDCPYPEYCKHIAAVLIFLSNNYQSEKSIEDVWKDAEKESSSLKLGNELVLPLKREAKSRFVKYFRKNIELEIEKEKKFMNKYIPLIVVDNDFWNYEKAITLKMQYIKNDGTTGALQNFSISKIPDIANYSFYDLLCTIHYYPQKRIPLEYVVGRVVKNDVMLYNVQDKNNISTVQKNEFNKIDIGFEIDSVDNDSVTFSLKMFGEVDGDSSYHELINVEFGGGYYYSYSLGGHELYYTQDPILSKFFKNVIFSNVGKKYRFDDIIEFKKLCEEYFYDKVEVKFDFKRVKVITAKSFPVLSIFEFDDYLSVDLNFRYLDRIFPYSESEELLKIEPDEKNKAIVLIQRNMEYEKKVDEYLGLLFKEDIITDYEFYFDTRMKNNSKYFYKLKFRHFMDFLKSYGQDLIDKDIEIRIDGCEESITAVKKKLNIKVSSGIDWFDITVKDADNKNVDFKIDPFFVKTGMLFSNNALVVLSEEDVNNLQLLQKNGLDKNGSLRIGKNDLSVVHELYSKADLEGGELLKETALLYEKLSNVKSIGRVNLPKKFNAKLRKYQKTGYKWLYFLHENNLNGCLADDMGLGKTVQTLALLQKLYEEEKFINALLIVPVSTIPNWVDEINRFTNGFSVLVFKGSGRKKYIKSMKDYNIIITSYHTFARDVELLQEVKFSYCILDEAQNIKNASTLHFKAVKLVNSEHKLTLTGTPVENSSSELWAQMNFLNPGLFGSFKNFKSQYGRQIEVDEDMDAAGKLKNKVRPFILRRKKEDVALDLPEKEIIDLYCEMEKDQKKVYQNYKEFYKQLLVDNANVEKQDYFQYFSAILRLRQTALFPKLADSKNKNISSTKFETLKEMIPEIISENHKILIFSQFVSVLKIIETFFKNKKYKYAYLDGKTKDRKAAINSFQNDSECNLFLISLKAGGVGINLTEADYVFIFDPWWNPAVENQAIDRAHRIGQTRKVIVYKMIVKDTIEEKIQILQKKKNDLVKNIISDDASVFNKLNKKDLISLIDE